MHHTAVGKTEENTLPWDSSVLEILLKDRAMNHAIIGSPDEDSACFHCKGNAEDKKTPGQTKKGRRTRDKAEIFTPSWICNEQNTLIDEKWFGRKHVFHELLHQSWKTISQKVTFQNTEGKHWQDYVDAPRMEITCGEAPYLVSRYDMVTREPIRLENRIGLLDRKLRIVNENTEDMENWFWWAKRAYQSIYGYELMGDNLFLARENLLLTFVDNLRHKFNRRPSIDELKEIAAIISWNLWQMDGMACTVPSDSEMNFQTQPEHTKQNPVSCKIKNWQTKKMTGLQIPFDAIVGNPPYQMETKGAGRQAVPLYPHFIEQSKKLNPRYLSCIIPSRWFAGGMGLRRFRADMMQDQKITHIVDYVNAKECFPNISISGGVCYFLRDEQNSGGCHFTNIRCGIKHTMLRRLDAFSLVIRYNQAVPILHKVRSASNASLDKIISPLMPYGLPTNYCGSTEKNSSHTLLLHSSSGISFVKRADIKKGQETIDTYKILISKTSAEHAGEPDKDGRFKIFASSMKVIGPGEVCTHSYFIIGNFTVEEEAYHALSYLKTRFVRFLVLLSLSAFNLSKQVFSLVPLQTFSEPWTDEKLYHTYGLTMEEIQFIEGMVRL